MKWEITDIDALGRIGKLIVNNKEMITPNLFPVIHPYRNLVDLSDLKKKVKFEQLQKLQKIEDVSVSYEELIKKVKINIQGIFSEIWKTKIKAHKEEIRCLDSRKVDSMLVAQQGQDWWQDFNTTLKVINGECEKIS